MPGLALLNQTATHFARTFTCLLIIITTTMMTTTSIIKLVSSPTRSIRKLRGPRLFRSQTAMTAMRSTL